MRHIPPHLLSRPSATPSPPQTPPQVGHISSHPPITSVRKSTVSIDSTNTIHHHNTHTNTPSDTSPYSSVLAYSQFRPTTPTVPRIPSHHTFTSASSPPPSMPGSPTPAKPSSKKPETEIRPPGSTHTTTNYAPRSPHLLPSFPNRMRITGCTPKHEGVHVGAWAHTWQDM